METIVAFIKVSLVTDWGDIGTYKNGIKESFHTLSMNSDMN